MDLSPSKFSMGSCQSSNMSGDGVGFVATFVGVELRRPTLRLFAAPVLRRPVVALAVDVDAVDVLDVIVSTSASTVTISGKNGVALFNLLRPGGMKRVFVSVTGGPSSSVNHC